MSAPVSTGPTGSTRKQSLELTAPLPGAFKEILTPEAVRFVAMLHRHIASTRQQLLTRRRQRQAQLDAGEMPDFLPETRHVRESEWFINPLPADLQDRRVEITGPTDRKMVINALNSGAKVFMADFEDANSPTWENLIQGQINLRDAVRRNIYYTSPEGKRYTLCEQPAVLMVRPRGWHLPEKHVLVDGHSLSGSIFDFGLYFFHNARELLERGTGPYFYLPKLESHLEARMWNDVFTLAQDELGIPRGSIKATVLIETLPGAFEAEEILYELREHSAGLNCGRWDYIFSFIKNMRNKPEYLLPDRSAITMTVPFMRAYALSVIRICHKHGAHAMGGMAAQIPIKDNPAANEAALEKVRADKEREVTDGHDGTWVAHPGLVPVATEIFNRHMPQPNQIDRRRDDVHVTAQDLTRPFHGPITEAGLRTNINVGIQYLEAWLRGNGCVPLYNLMEDAATSEISRTQIWQWIRHGGTLSDGRKITPDLVRHMTLEELHKIRADLGEWRFDAGEFALASEIFIQLATADELAEFLTLPAYEYLD
ncbi:MAG TPA: malate synthase A [Phycisphaerae bacterium]|jgi:malate synthase|nr:malate synthase A [Phycisphaerae bacterium]HOB74730.1 malate synthase A [Phycisphaerae bacterium]HOJ55266.1 malate synthase A [Phycisphaerae bacterium]HOL27895.1 malate synthase A [Phycisphaerae bacterium]HPP22344.1 malate synthase A [Phycisphaerae bacterium]